MNINNNYGQLNINNDANYRLNPSKRGMTPVNKDGFVREKYLTSPQKNKHIYSRNVSVNNLYSPSQLLKAYSNPNYVKFLINTNENLQKLIKENDLDGKLYPENITKVTKSHLNATCAIGLQIADKMNISAADKKLLEQACMFHDFGKILIPNEILEKPSYLTINEKKIMDLHSELGAELLSSTGMNERVLELIKNHHKPLNENNDILGQILSVADIYSALREERSYKSAMSEKEAFALLDQKAKNGEVSTEVVNALKSSLYSEYAA